MMYEAGVPYAKEAAIAKLFCTETAKHAADNAVQIFGGLGYMDETPVSRYYRDIRASTIAEGTSEVQKHIMLTGHIVDGLTTQVAPHVWNTLSETEKKMFTDVTREAADRATAQIKKREGELVDEFKKKGLQVVNVNRQSFVDAVLKNSTPESMGFDRKDYDRIVAIK